MRGQDMGERLSGLERCVSVHDNITILPAHTRNMRQEAKFSDSTISRQIARRIDNQESLN